MPIPVKVLHSDGNLRDAPISADSLDEVASKEPEGIYTVARTYHRTKAVLFDAHLDRLEESARLEQIEFNLDPGALRHALALMIEESQVADSRFRITIPKNQPDQIWLAAEPLKMIPPEFKNRGVLAATCKVTRPNPKAKSNAWVNLRNEAAKGISQSAYEGIIVNEDGFLMEGFSSNFYAILEGILYTAGHDILHGVARRIALIVAPEVIPVHFQPIHIDQLTKIEEAFLTSSSRGIVPIVKIDDVRIADGLPGASIRQLSKAYDHWVEEHVEPIA